ncbi:histone deacetylase family protein [Colwellia sp. 4_MG-2023]|jgi:acetoin utilization deacetylase AcuC-like enzyme|uniref:histone deacetylase family protein n=1 Tax=unclassified Colwellia TaxID=196834 RepID=UPI001C088A0F|nr:MULTISPECIES: histone deacetylase family protein [unclassified Colwellia]MBU2923973.1 histone deacetylase family protein [Colwellia sp. C2M11]MDO6488699.1 histone deacetylase family protein [Colwellia sp. 6_MG-2023]MDO6507925.1 histone deacetylase family protein [Colwellia sp. 5_MG-2023]MDO6556522.1 histone deacetylase family protein [Colwellia sp. 4_MG-2023]MDO6653658.1 histone deacetylase family protein [Colwellia sp. 3_MG-2023]
MTIGIIGHYRCGDHHNLGKDHPENGKRLTAISDQLIRSGLDYVVRQFDAKPIDKSLLSLAHTQKYIDFVFNNAPTSENENFVIGEDSVMDSKTLTSIMLSAGAVIDGVDLVMDNTLNSAFCTTRPPGHHAEHDKGMGFCFFNNIAIAAAYAKKTYKLKRIAIVDFDVHHGNGTEDIVRNYFPTVDDTSEGAYLFCSSYQYPFYPFDINESDTPPIINTPLAATTKSEGFRKTITEHWLPALNKFKPEIIFISAGFDAHIEDEMSQICLTESDYRWITDELKVIAQDHAKGRIVSVLEGGYSLSSLGRSVVAHINGLIGN